MAESNAYTQIKQDAIDVVTGKTDYNKAAELMSSPDVLDKYKLRAEQLHAVRILINGEEAREKMQQQEVYKQTWADVFPKLMNKTLTPDDITDRVIAGTLNEDQAKYLKFQLEHPEAAIKTDALYYLKTFEKIMNGGNARKDIYYGAGEGQKLSTDAAGHLMAMQFTKEGKDQRSAEHFTNDPWFHLTFDQFKDTFRIKEETMEEAIQRKLKGLPTPKRDVDKFYDASTKLFTAIEKDNLKGRKIWDAGQEILKAFVVGKAINPSPPLGGKSDPLNIRKNPPVAPNFTLPEMNY